MNLLAKYSLHCGVKISEPFIQELYYPITFDKYITIHTQAKFDSRRYEYFEEVVELLRKFAPEYKIVQIGVNEDPSIAKVDLDLRGKTNIRQMAYVIKNAACHIGPDSFPVHLSAHFNVPFVGIYPQMYANQSAPLFGSARKICLQSDRKGKRPTYQAVESPKTVNTITPSLIVNSALDILKISAVAPETVFVSEKFGEKTLNIAPLPVNSENTIPRGEYSSITIHCDILSEYLGEREDAVEYFNNCLAYTLNFFEGTKIRIRTDVPILPAVLHGFKDRIGVIEIIDSEAISEKYLHFLRRAAIPFLVEVDKDDSAAKLKWLEFFVKNRDDSVSDGKKFLDTFGDTDKLTIKSNYIWVNPWNQRSHDKMDSIIAYTK